MPLSSHYRRHEQNSKAECIPTAGSLLMYCFVQPLHRLFHPCLLYRMAAFQHRFKLQGIPSCVHLTCHKQFTCSGRCRDTMILSFIYTHTHTTCSLVHTPWPSEELFFLFLQPWKKIASMFLSDFFHGYDKKNCMEGLGTRLYYLYVSVNNYLRNIRQKLVYRFFLMMQHGSLVHDTQQLE